MFFHKNVHSCLSKSCKSECPREKYLQCLPNQGIQGKIRKLVNAKDNWGNIRENVYCSPISGFPNMLENFSKKTIFAHTDTIGYFP